MKAVSREELKPALETVIASVRQHPQTDSGLALRRFLWSMWTSGKMINLCRLSYVLDDRHGAAVATIFQAFLTGCYREDTQRQVLEKSGEMKRLDDARRKANGRAFEYPPQ